MPEERFQTLSHVGAAAATGTALWFTLGTPWAVPIFLVHGVLLNFLYAGQHELSHWTVFRTAWLNEWVGRAFGFVVFYPRTFDQVQHIAHHRYTQDWNRDGELSRERYSLASYLRWMSGLTYWYTRWRRILRFSCGVVTEPYLPERRHPEFIREARFHMAGYIAIAAASILAHSWAALLLWLAPMLAMKPMHQLQNTIEHLGLPHDANVLSNTRSTRTKRGLSLARVADAIPHRSSRLSRRSLPPPARIGPEHFRRAGRGPAVDDLLGVPAGGAARLCARQD